MNLPLVDLDAQHDPIRIELVAALTAVVDSGQFIGGPFVDEFEEAAAGYLGVDHAIGVSSGTDALLASLMALGIGEGDEVITTPFTFCATGEAILRVGATPVFADIDPRTFNIDPNELRAAVTDATRAILPVHLYGQPCRMDQIEDIASEYGLDVVEDAAQAMGSRFRGQPAGTIGDVGCFSFFPTKPLGGLGDGGLVVTDDDALADELRLICSHGSRPKFHQVRTGGNFRLDAIQAAALSVKLKHLDDWNDARRERAARHDSRFASVDGITTPHADPDCHHVYHQYTVRTPRRDAFCDWLDAGHVGWGIYYPEPLHLQPAYGHLGHQPGDFPEAERAADEVVSIPV